MGDCFYADLTSGEIKEFFAAAVRPRRFAQWPDRPTDLGRMAMANLYALVTNTASNGTGGIVYELSEAPEPGSTCVNWHRNLSDY